MEIIKITKNNQQEIIKKTAAVLERSGLVIYPTETCYGAGVDATNSQAVDKLWQYKKERGNKPILVAVDSLSMAQKYGQINPLAKKIFAQYLPGPVSIIVQGKHLVDSRIESSLGTLGIRMPDHPLILTLIKQFDRPITSTSANISDNPNPYSINEVLGKTNQSLIDLIINQGKIPPNLPSTLIDTTGKKIKILRQGKIKIN